MLEAVIFDVDGTLVDSEQEGHRIAFNDAFAAFGLDDRWDRGTYRALLATTGGEQRIREWLSRRGAQNVRGVDESRRLAAEMHRFKTQRFMELTAGGSVPARPGAQRLVSEVTGAGIAAAVATTGSRAWVGPLLDQLFGPHCFTVTVTGEDVQHRKPHPEAYLLALERLGVTGTGAVAIEDSGPGYAAATGAGLAVVVVANPETDMDEVRGADVVVDGFGEGDRPAHVLADRFGVARGMLTCETLTALLDARASGFTGGD